MANDENTADDVLTPGEEAEFKDRPADSTDSQASPETEQQAEKPEQKISEPEKAEKSDKQLNPEIQRRDKQIAHHREKAEKLEKQLKELQGQSPKAELPQSSNPMEVVRLAKALEGHSEEEITFITQNASDKTIDSIIDASKSEWVQTAIQARREKVAKDKAVPGPSNVSKAQKSQQDIDKSMTEGKFNEVAEQALRETKESGTGI